MYAPMNDEPIRAVGYTRVSTAAQADEGVSLEAQRVKIESYCTFEKAQLAGMFVDEGISGRAMKNRPALYAALKRVRAVRGVLIVYSLSRLARSTRDAIRIADELERSGCDLVSLTEKIDTTSAIGRFFFQIMAGLGELESQQVSDRVRFAQNHCLAVGRALNQMDPYGWCKVDGVLQPVDTEQRVIAQMFELYAGGMSRARIAAWLNERGVRSKMGGRWHPSTVGKVMRRSERVRSLQQKNLSDSRLSG